MRFLGRSTPGSEVIFGSTLGSEVMGLLVPVVSSEGSEGMSSVDLEVLLSRSQADLPVDSEVMSFRASEMCAGSEVIFLRQDA